MTALHAPGTAWHRPGDTLTALLARLAAALPSRYAGAVPALAASGLIGAAAYLILAWAGHALRG